MSLPGTQQFLVLFHGFEAEPFVAFLSTLELCVLCSRNSQGLFLREGLTLPSVLPGLGGGCCCAVLRGLNSFGPLPAAAMEHPVWPLVTERKGRKVSPLSEMLHTQNSAARWSLGRAAQSELAEP